MKFRYIIFLNPLKVGIICLVTLVAPQKSYSGHSDTLVHIHISRIDSLFKTLKTSKDTNKVKVLNDLCREYQNQNPDKALKYGNQAFDLAKRIDFKKGIASSLFNIGYVYDDQSRYEEAIKHYLQALKIRKELGDRNGIAANLNNIGNVHYALGNYAKAISYYLQSLKIYEKLVLPVTYSGYAAPSEKSGEDRDEGFYKQGISLCLNNIGLVHWRQGKYAKAIDYYLQALKINEELLNSLYFNKRRAEFRQLIAGNLNNIAIIYYEQENYAKSLEYDRQSLKVYKELRDKKGIGRSLNNIGEVYKIQGRYLEAEAYYLQSLKAFEKLGDKQLIAASLNNIGIIYSLRGGLSGNTQYYEKAIEYCKKSLAIAREIGSKEYIKEAYLTLAETYARLGEHTLAPLDRNEHLRKAYKYHQRYSEIKDAVFNEESSKQIAEMQAKYENEKNENRIALLTREKKVRKLELSRKEDEVKKQRITIIALVLALVLAFLLYNRYRLKQKEKFNKELLKQQKLRLKVIVETQEKERKRIARDLHDGIGQLLAGLKINMGRFDKEIKNLSIEKKKAFNTSTKVLDQACNELRSISHQMMPRALSEAGLAATMDDLLDSAIKNSKLKYNFETHGIKKRLPENIEIGIYRIFQELLSNILKHAKANEIFIHLFKNKGHLILVVEDNGLGFKLNGDNKGMGLINIATRVEAMNGTFTLNPGHKQGTIINVRVPLMNEY
ncbi:MAG: tetratricopeptide repeat protein [Cytophagales bacterium]|nr:tetratricopeptide repeat protein [Cytophagales bacterium]